MKSKRVTGLVLVVFSAILLIGGPLMFLGSPGGVVVAHLPGGYVYMDDGDPVIIWLGGGFNEDRFGDARPAAIHGEFEKIAAKGDYVFGFVQQKGTKSDSRVAPGWFILNTALGRSELSLDLATYNNRIRELGLDPSRVDYQTP